MKLVQREPLGEIANIGLPIFLLIISIGSFIWFIIEVKKKRLELKTMVSWLVLNTLYIISVVYVLIVAIIHFYNISSVPNVFNLIAYYMFGISMENGREWIIILILGFVAYILVKTLSNSIRISKLNMRVDDLSKEVAILSGKINKTVNYGDDNLFIIKKTSKEVKIELKEKVKIAKAKAKAKEKIEVIKTGKSKFKNDH